MTIFIVGDLIRLYTSTEWSWNIEIDSNGLLLKFCMNLLPSASECMRYKNVQIHNVCDIRENEL